MKLWKPSDFKDLNYTYLKYPVSWQGNYYDCKLSKHKWKDKKSFYLPFYLDLWGGWHPIEITIQ